MNQTTQQYNNREIDHFLSDVKSQLSRIEIQTTKTNGRVSSLEGHQNTHDISDERRFGEIGTDMAVLKSKVANIEKLGWAIALGTLANIINQIFDLI